MPHPTTTTMSASTSKRDHWLWAETEHTLLPLYAEFHHNTLIEGSRYHLFSMPVVSIAQGHRLWPIEAEVHREGTARRRGQPVRFLVAARRGDVHLLPLPS